MAHVIRGIQSMVSCLQGMVEGCGESHLLSLWKQGNREGKSVREKRHIQKYTSPVSWAFQTNQVDIIKLNLHSLYPCSLGQREWDCHMVQNWGQSSRRKFSEKQKLCERPPSSTSADLQRMGVGRDDKMGETIVVLGLGTTALGGPIVSSASEHHNTPQSLG